MTDKELIKSLSRLNSFQPDQNWVSKNRDLLSSQISNGDPIVGFKLGFFARVSILSRRLSQPAPIALMIALFFSAGLFGVRASQHTAPGDPFYFAKTMSEKAKLAVTFNEKEKARLTMDFAGQRAIEIIEIMDKTAEGVTDPRLETLAHNFKQEIASARTRLSKIEEQSAKQATVSQPVAGMKPSEEARPTETAAPEPEKTPAKNDEGLTEKDSENVAAAGVEAEITAKVDASVSALLDEAEKLFNEEQYQAAAQKLKEIKIQNINH